MLIKKSFAKINLYLEIVGRDKNGYHLLDSLMVLIDIADQISIEESDALILEIKDSNSEILQKNWQENIIIKAVNLLSEKFSFSPNIKITLEKNIPIAAGLGGGSSNAATILLMLNDFYNLNLTKKELLDFGLKLGADVPFFINNESAFATGVGEILEPANINHEDLFLLIVNPKKPLSTPAVFAEFKKDNPEISGIRNHKIYDKHLAQTIQHHRNDLQNSAIKIMPEIANILDDIKNQKGCLISRMSGSGASCFGIFGSKNDLELAYFNIQKVFPNFYIQKSKIL